MSHGLDLDDGSGFPRTRQKIIDKLRWGPANTLWGNNTGAVGPVKKLNASQVKALLAIVPGDVTGLGTVATLASDTDGTLAANSDTRVATQKAVKTYADQLIASADAMVFKGVLACAANPNYPAADAGWTYRCSSAGKIGGASGKVVEIGDLIMCVVDGSASGNEATVGANWIVTQTNIDGAVVGPAASTSGNFTSFSGTSGKVVQDSGFSSDTDGLLAANLDTRFATQKATKTYVDTGLALKSPIANPTFTTGITTPKAGVSATDGTGAVTLADQTAVASNPSAGNAVVFVEKICGRELLFFRGATGSAFPVEPAWWWTQRITFRPSTGAGFTVMGALTANGTVTTPAMTEALGHFMQVAGAASAAALTGLQTGNVECLIGSAVPNQLQPSGTSKVPNLSNGLWLNHQVYGSDASYNNTGAGTGTRLFVGYTDQTATVVTGADNPAGSRIGFSRCHVNGGLTDTDWFFTTKDGATETRTDTTLAFTAQHQYEFWIYCPANGTTVTWRIDDITAGTSATGTVAANLPTNSVRMRSAVMCQTVDATARTLQITKFHHESCR